LVFVETSPEWFYFKEQRDSVSISLIADRFHCLAGAAFSARPIRGDLENVHSVTGTALAQADADAPIETVGVSFRMARAQGI
jgi:hypothetical protein